MTNRQFNPSRFIAFFAKTATIHHHYDEETSYQNQTTQEEKKPELNTSQRKVCPVFVSSCAVMRSWRVCVCVCVALGEKEVTVELVQRL